MNTAEQLPVTDLHAEKLRRTEKNCTELREKLNMPTGFAAWFDGLPKAVRSVLWKAAKIPIYKHGIGGTYQRTCESRFCTPAEIDRLEVMAGRMAKHFEGLK